MNEFYCDVLELEESGEVGSPGDALRQGSSSQRASLSGRRAARSSPRATTPGRDTRIQNRAEIKKDIEGVSL